MIRKALIAAVLLALGACGPAMAQKAAATQPVSSASAQLDLAAAAYVGGDYAVAVKWWRLVD